MLDERLGHDPSKADELVKASDVELNKEGSQSPQASVCGFPRCLPLLPLGSPPERDWREQASDVRPTDHPEMVLAGAMELRDVVGNGRGKPWEPPSWRPSPFR
jgi:hypothetical protein